MGTDGANVMLGARNSVMSRLLLKQPALVDIHCYCHIAALVANTACKVLPNDLEDLTTDVWYYFQTVAYLGPGLPGPGPGHHWISIIKIN